MEFCCSEFTDTPPAAANFSAFSFGQYEINVFPNPITDNLVIDFAEAVNQTVEVRLRAIDGKIVLAQPYENMTDVSNLPAGSYFLEVLVEGKMPRQFKVMKQQGNLFL